MLLKRIFALVCLAVLLYIGYWCWLIFDMSRTAVTKIPHPESAIFITVDMMRETRTAQVEDPDDVAFLMRLFGRRYTAEWDNPICPFNRVQVSFVHGRDRVDFFPAADDCNLIRYGRAPGMGGKLFAISIEDKRKLDMIWKNSAARPQTGRR